MSDYVQDLDGRLREAASPVDAVAMARYMRDQFSFLGVNRPARKTITRTFLAERGLPAAKEIDRVLDALWCLEYREAQYVGVELVQRSRRRLDESALPWVETLIVRKSWWDTVDALASHTVGDLFARFPSARRAALARWRRPGNLWLRRAALLFQLRYKEQTDQALLFAVIEKNLGDREFFINKAIGWALRERSKHDADAVRRFVDRTDLAPLSRREAFKWLDRPRG